MIHAQWTEALKRRLNEIYVRHTGQDYETVVNALERDRFMTTDQAMEFGLIDKVISNRDSAEAPA
jgi:ATP-dependent Clp protease protease subunit